MYTLKVEYKYQAGDAIWFMNMNKPSKGIISRVIINAYNNGLKSRGYKVKKFFNKLIKASFEEVKLNIHLRYEIDLLNYETESYHSSPHHRNENEVFSTKQELLNSL